MNREIKFRAWQKWHEYMFTPDYIDFKRTTIEELEGILIKIKRLSEHEYHYRLYSNKD